MDTQRKLICVVNDDQRTASILNMSIIEMTTNESRKCGEDAVLMLCLQGLVY